MRKPVIGLMGPGTAANPVLVDLARALGTAIAARDWVLLTGGRDAGVMDAACRGAKEIEGSLTIGILPSPEAKVSRHVDVAIFTDLGNGRNNVNALTSDVVVICGMGPGTASEAALAIKARKPVVLIALDELSSTFFRRLGGSGVHSVATPEQVIALIDSHPEWLPQQMARGRQMEGE